MSRGLFVVGTDTEVGKTVVCAGLLCAARARGEPRAYLKPLATGGEQVGGAWVSPDAALVAELAGIDGPVAELTQVCLAEPLAPLAAARHEGVELDFATLLAGCRARLTGQPFTIVEGVGGLLVPIAPGATVLDLVVALDLPALVVGRPGLGTINHTSLTLNALAEAGARIGGFVFSHAEAPSEPPDPSLHDNPGLVTELTGAAYLGTLPHLASLCADTLAPAIASLPVIDLL